MFETISDLKVNSRNTCAEIDLTAYTNNIMYFRQNCAPSSIMAVIKADAYGHGSVHLGKKALECGVDYLAVAFLEEALELRKAGIEAPILVLNYFEPSFTDVFLENSLTATIFSIEQFLKVKEMISEGALKVHAKIDTGMGRLGIRSEESSKLIKPLLEDKKFFLEGIYSHFSSADDSNLSYTEYQYSRFREVVQENKGKVKLFHIANSAAGEYLNKNLFDYVRIGISSYGLDPQNLKRGDFLEPVLSWSTVISYIKQVKAGESISYGRTYTAKNKIIAATIPVGYADGYNRLLSNRGAVLINGKRCPVIGRICMDQFIVDVSDAGSVKMGDKVILLGKSVNEEISAEEIANKINTINYEVTCGISKRVPRRYVT